MARKRERWKRYQGRIDPSRLVFVDETWAKTNMTRLHGWSTKGQRLVAKVPHGHWKTLTFIAGLRCDGLCAPFVFDGPINGVSFLAWVERIWRQRPTCSAAQHRVMMMPLSDGTGMEWAIVSSLSTVRMRFRTVLSTVISTMRNAGKWRLTDGAALR